MTRAERIAAIREKIQRQVVKERERQQKEPVGRAPRYDEVFFEGVAWLDKA